MLKDEKCQLCKEEGKEKCWIGCCDTCGKYVCNEHSVLINYGKDFKYLICTSCQNILKEVLLDEIGNIAKKHNCEYIKCHDWAIKHDTRVVLELWGDEKTLEKVLNKHKESMVIISKDKYNLYDLLSNVDIAIYNDKERTAIVMHLTPTLTHTIMFKTSCKAKKETPK